MEAKDLGSDEEGRKEGNESRSRYREKKERREREGGVLSGLARRRD